MQFENTETYKNLARSFAGESQAGMRYQLVAKVAKAEGFITLSDEIKHIAKNETYHAKRFFEILNEKTNQTDNIEFEAGYPYHTGTLAESLQFAADDEKSESTEIYPNFALTAEKEGFKEIAAFYKMIAQVESSHNIVFQYLADSIKNGTLYKTESPMLWVCGECGYMTVATEPWEVCPLCKAGQGDVELHLPFEGVKI